MKFHVHLEKEKYCVGETVYGRVTLENTAAVDVTRIDLALRGFLTRDTDVSYASEKWGKLGNIKQNVPRSRFVSAHALGQTIPLRVLRSTGAGITKTEEAANQLVTPKMLAKLKRLFRGDSRNLRKILKPCENMTLFLQYDVVLWQREGKQRLQPPTKHTFHFKYVMAANSPLQAAEFVVAAVLRKPLLKSLRDVYSCCSHFSLTANTVNVNESKKLPAPHRETVFHLKLDNCTVAPGGVVNLQPLVLNKSASVICGLVARLFRVEYVQRELFHEQIDEVRLECEEKLVLPGEMVQLPSLTLQAPELNSDVHIRNVVPVKYVKRTKAKLQKMHYPFLVECRAVYERNAPTTAEQGNDVAHFVQRKSVVLCPVVQSYDSNRPYFAIRYSVNLGKASEKLQGIPQLGPRPRSTETVDQSVTAALLY